MVQILHLGSDFDVLVLLYLLTIDESERRGTKEQETAASCSGSMASYAQDEREEVVRHTDTAEKHVPISHPGGDNKENEKAGGSIQSTSTDQQHSYRPPTYQQYSRGSPANQRGGYNTSINSQSTMRQASERTPLVRTSGLSAREQALDARLQRYEGEQDW